MGPATLFVALACLASTIYGSCVREYFAQPVIYDKAMDIDFYYTGINLASVSACASFCGDRHFCRTAVYNRNAKTCAISYEYTLNCRYNSVRYADYDPTNATSNLIQVACVTKCNEPEENRIARKPQSVLTSEESESLLRSGNPRPLRKVEIVTGEPNDGIRPTTTDYAELARARPQKDALPARVFDKAADGFVNQLVIENITGTLPLNDSPGQKLNKNGGGQMCYRTIPYKYLLGGSFEQHYGKTKEECRCLCAATYSAAGLHKCQSFQLFSNGACILNKGNHLGKFDLIEDFQATYHYVDCDVQVLLDMAALHCGNGDTQSLLEKKSESDGEKSRHPGVNLGRKALSPPATTTVEGSGGSATTEKEPTTAFPEIESSGDGPSTSSSAETTTTSQKTESSTTSEETTTSQHHNTEQVMTSSTTVSPTSSEESKPAESSTSIVTEELLTSSPAESTASETEVSSTKTVPTESTTTSVVTSEVSSTSSESSTNDRSTTSENSIQEKTELPIKLSGCFETIRDHMMISTQFGIEHDVSMEECQCFCANSKQSGKHKVDCASATYYHNDRDCILNLEDRHQKKKFFERHFSDFNVSYIGLTCDRATAISSVVDPSLALGCRHVETVPVTRAPRIERRKGEHSDRCFVELPSFVLEGTAQHIESSVSAQQCKCLCAGFEQKSGEACQSFQYYYDSATCLLSKNNRFSNPERFNFAPSSQERSYFEYTCASKEQIQRDYIITLCEAPAAGNNVASDDSRTQTLTEQPAGLNENHIDASGETLSRTTRKVDAETSSIEVSTHASIYPKNHEKDVGTHRMERVSGEAEPAAEKSTEVTTLEPSTESATLTSVIGDVTTPEYTDSTQPESEGTSTESGETKVEEAENSTEKKETQTTKAVDVTNKSTTEQTTTTTKSKLRRMLRKKPQININRGIPEAEGLDDKDFEEELEQELSSEIESATDVPITPPPQALLDDAPKPPPKFKLNKKLQGVKTRKFTEKESKEAPKIEATQATPTTTETATTTEATTTTEAPTTTTTVITSTYRTTTTAAYPPAGRCTYSALYQTAFLGRRLLKTVHVKSPADCFAACFALRCRSANLIAQGPLNQCELFRDSLIDYRRPDMIGYDGATVYFDGIRCDGA